MPTINSMLYAITEVTHIRNGKRGFFFSPLNNFLRKKCMPSGQELCWLEGFALELSLRSEGTQLA